ncbi:hypothetical protein [Streptomyces erythrochromogenes]|uniref:hypothetical protein n=1 Tax=Streptomyces erythrochromogenes TaxID=285574 RepID=UPI003688DE72
MNRTYCEARTCPSSPDRPGTNRASLKELGRGRTRLTAELPDDYKEFIEIYGGSNWDGYLYALEPDCPNQNYDLLKWAKFQYEDLEDLWEFE